MFSPGSIYLSCGITEKPRPVVIVSRQDLNLGDYVVVVPLTTAKLQQRQRLPNCVPLAPSKHGVDRHCVAQADAVAQIRKEYLDIERGPVGTLDAGSFRALVQAIGYVIAADCEPV